MKNSNADKDLSFSEYCLKNNIKPIRQDQITFARKPSAKNFIAVPPSVVNLNHILLEDAESYSEYCKDGQKHVIKHLRQGKYPIFATLDLHNYTQGQAVAKLDQFIAKYSATASSCLKIVHGKGLNSPDNRAVLKVIVRRYLEHHPRLLAYASGGYAQGGDGVTLVRLKSNC